MATPFEEIVVYLRVAQAFDERRYMSDRDRALVMAGTCACAMRMPFIADFCRELILKNNSGHMLRKYADFEDAISDPDFGVFVKQVRRKLPPHMAKTKISLFDYECEVRQEDYESKVEFVAAIMGVGIDWLEEQFGENKSGG
ncbi:MAG: hypothetical protein AAF623_05370 [Planctomycetota bacterium]